jgi:hypothetical protein
MKSVSSHEKASAVKPTGGLSQHPQHAPIRTPQLARQHDRPACPARPPARPGGRAQHVRPARLPARNITSAGRAEHAQHVSMVSSKPCTPKPKPADRSFVMLAMPDQNTWSALGSAGVAKAAEPRGTPRSAEKGGADRGDGGVPLPEQECAPKDRARFVLTKMGARSVLPGAPLARSTPSNLGEKGSILGMNGAVGGGARSAGRGFLRPRQRFPSKSERGCSMSSPEKRPHRSDAGRIKPPRLPPNWPNG